MRVNEEEKSADIERRDINYILPAYIRLYLFQSKNEEPEKITFPMFRSVPHPYKKGVEIPIEYVPDDSPVAIEIARDGEDIPEATPETEAEADKKEEDYNVMKARIAELEDEVAKTKGEPEHTTPPESKPVEGDISKKEEEFIEANVREDAAREALENKATSPAQAAFARQQPEPESATTEASTNQPTPERLAAAKAPDIVLPPGTPSDYGGSRDKRDQRRIAKDIAPEKEINEDEEMEDSSLVERAKENKES